MALRVEEAVVTLNKNWSLEGGEARTEDYRTYRTTLGVGAVCDVDQLEYDWVDGRPLFAVELSVADRQSPAHPFGIPEGGTPSQGFLDKVVEKVGPERPQGRCARYYSKVLGIPLLLLVYIKGELDLGVWTRFMDTDTEWTYRTLAAYEQLLRNLHNGVVAQKAEQPVFNRRVAGSIPVDAPIDHVEPDAPEPTPTEPCDRMLDHTDMNWDFTRT